jgi:hypothetical protein
MLDGRVLLRHVVGQAKWGMEVSRPVWLLLLIICMFLNFNDCILDLGALSCRHLSCAWH